MQQIESINSSRITSLTGDYFAKFSGKLWIDGNTKYHGVYSSAKIDGTIRLKSSQVKLAATLRFNRRLIFGTFTGMVRLDLLSTPPFNMVIDGTLWVNGNSMSMTLIGKSVEQKLFEFL